MMRATLFGIMLIALLSPPATGAEATVQRLVSIKGVGGVTLSGTIEIPPGNGARPAVLLLSGSGPTDRNGNQPPTIITDLLKQVADGLAEQGIISLRFDKRGVNRTQIPTDPAKLSDFFTWENYAGDAAAAFRFLREQPQVDPNRVGIVGHSEGGIIALDIARTLKGEGHPPIALILLGTPGRPMDVILTDQLTFQLKRAGAPQQFTESLLAAHARISAAIRKDGNIPDDVPPPLALLYPKYLGKFLQGQFSRDTIKLAVEFSGPVLIISGGADIQISPDRDAKALDAAFSTRKGDVHTLAIIPQASHNLKILQNPDDPGYAGPVAPAAMEQLKKWAVEHLK